MKYDFGGWATRNDLPCADGRVIKKDAFKAQNGQTVPLVWMHNHADPANVLGLAHLENRDEGVYAFCEFNDTESGKTARELVKHGDVQSLSIFANQLKQAGHDVVHGIIREVSLVLAGANPGAFIDDVVMHGDGETGIILGYNEMIMGQLEHSADEPDKKKKEEKDEPNDESGNGEKKDDKVETIEDIFKSMNEKQQTAVFAMMAEFVDKENPKKEDDESKGGDDNMKHNVFDTDKRDDKSFLSHAAQKEILDLAKSSGVGSLKAAMEIYMDEHSLQHDGIRCMTLTQNVDPLVYQCITNSHIDAVNAYIEEPMTASTVKEEKGGPINRQQITSELIYYWMIAYHIPFECQKWHLNRLLMLIRICNAENKPPKKRSKRDLYRHHAEVNAANRKKFNSKG